MKQSDAIEIMEEPIPEWQMQESLKRLAEIKVDPAAKIPGEDFFKSLADKEE